MKMPEDCRLTYTVFHEAWYGQDRRAIDHPQLSISASSNGGGVAWEFTVEEVDLGRPRPDIRLAVFDDAFEAFQHVPEFFAAVGEKQPKSLAEVVAILDSLGAADETERVRPARR